MTVDNLTAYAESLTDNVFSVVKTNGNTLNTPHKDKLTGGHSAGICFILGQGDYMNLMYFAIGLEHGNYGNIFVKARSGGKWCNSWYSVNMTEHKPAADEETANMEMIE